MVSIRNAGSRGFTLIEMLVVAPVVILTIGAFLTVIISMTGEVLSSRASTTLAYGVQDAINRIEEDVKLSTTFLSTNNISLVGRSSAQQGYNNDATDFTNVGGASGTSLILNMLVTNGNPLSTSSNVVYLTNKPNSCASAQVIANTPMTMNVVYFTKVGADGISSLWRRTIMPLNYNGSTSVRCTTPWQQPSCAPQYTSTFCKTNDVELVKGVTAENFTLDYFGSANGTTANAVASSTSTTDDNRGAALQTLSTVNVSISASQTAAGRLVERSASLRASRLDTNATTIAANIVTTPSAPTGVTATMTVPGSIAIKWDPGGTTYNLQYDTNSSFSAPQSVNSISGSTYTVPNLNGTSLYYFRVQAINSAGTSGWSSVANSYSTISNGLVGWYPLNGNANDAIGAADGTIINGAPLTTGQNGSANGAYAFNGTNRYISVPSTFGIEAANLTISVWVNSPVSTNSGAFVKLGNGAAGYGIGIGSGNFDNATPGTKIIMLYEGVRWIPSTTNLSTGWHHIVMVIDSAGTPSTYRDGVLLGTYAGSAGTAPRGNTSAFGGNTAATARYFNGSLDDIRIYSRALSATEISQLYADSAR